MRVKLVCSFLLVVGLFSGQIGDAQSGDFTIIALPDTQNEAQFFPNVLESQIRWIVAHRAELNIQMVLGEGDIVNDFSSPAQQESANEAFGILDNAGMPYMLAIGNHDYDGAKPKAGRPVSGVNRFFGPARYAGKAYYLGNFPVGSNENFFGVLNIGGKDFLFLILEFVPRPASMDWAASILRANPDKEAIIVTHSFIYVDDTRVDPCDTHDMPRGNETGEDMWAQLRQFPNVIMVVSGHLTGGQAARRADLGDQGNLVNQVFTNYQTFPHGGDGWLRIMTFHPAANSITVQTFSPFLNKFRTDERNQFTLFYHNPHLTRGTGTLSGLVRDSDSCRPMAGVSVSAGGASTTTDAHGHYTFTLAPGQYVVTATAAGAAPQTKSETVNDSFDTDLNFYFGKVPLSCALNTASPSVTICSPAEGALVSSPVQVVAGSTDTRQVLSMDAFLDGNEVLELAGGQLTGFVNASPGPHKLRITARDSANATPEQTVDFTVIGPTAPLDIGVTPSSAQISLGDSADFTLSLSSDGSLNEPVTLSCGNLPRGTRCVFDRRQIETKDLPATVKLTILTAALHSAVHGGRRDVGMVAGLFIIFGTAWMGLMLGIVTGRRRKIYGVMMLLGIAALVAVIGCQGVITPDNRGSFTATVTSKSGKVQQTTNIELTLK
jgi:hypothetical protein